MPTKAKNGKALLIVESPSKVKTISGYLGNEFLVDSSMGHIRDLPQPSELPENLKKGPVGKFAVNIDDDFDPYYVVNPDKRKKSPNSNANSKMLMPSTSQPMVTAKVKRSPGTSKRF